VRKLKLALGAILLLAVPVTLAAAQTSVPTVAVTHARGSITLEAPGPIGAGATRFTYSGRGQFNLLTLRPGVTLDQLRATLSRNDEAALGLLFLEASAGPGRALTVDLRPDTTYVVGAGAGSSAALTTFTTGAPTGAQAPRPDARIRMVDYGFRGRTRCPGTALFGFRTRVRRSTSRLRSRCVPAWPTGRWGAPSVAATRGRLGASSAARPSRCRT
jgi:hypothetical protein